MSSKNITLIKNVDIFDGTGNRLISGSDVVIKNNRIEEIIPSGTRTDPSDTVIDGQGKTLMPGLIDAHTHLSICANIIEMANMRTWDYIGPLMGVEAERYLMRGFTSVRDVGGPTLGLKQLIDQGLAKGPRIFSSGMGISQTAGHGDWRNLNSQSSYFTGSRNIWTDMNFFFLADGVAEVQKAVRETLAKQAAQVKICVGGGVTSLVDPLEAVQYTLPELQAANEEATRYGTYVCVHVHADAGIQMALDAGIKSIEHGMLIKEDTMKRLVDEDAWLCPQAFLVMQPIEGNPVFANPIQKAKMQKAQNGAVNEFRWAKEYGAKVAWGTDMFGDRSAFDNTLREFEFRAQFFSNEEQLQQVTGNNGQLLAMSNMKHPYPGAKLGVIEPGAYADLLIVDGDPIRDINVMIDYDNNLKLIMKDGKIYKNTL